MAFWLLPRKLLVQLERLQFGRCLVVSRHNLQRFHSFFISDCSGYCLVIPLPSFEFHPFLFTGARLVASSAVALWSLAKQALHGTVLIQVAF